MDYISGLFAENGRILTWYDYIRAIHFDSFKVPKVPFQLPVSRQYYGLKEMREGVAGFSEAHSII